jgi:hypothetical protein
MNELVLAVGSVTITLAIIALIIFILNALHTIFGIRRDVDNIFAVKIMLREAIDKISKLEDKLDKKLGGTQ